MPPIVEDGGEPAIGRAQRRLLKRIFNGRTVAIVVDDRQLLTYRQAMAYLQSLPADARDAAYADMKAKGHRE